MDECDICQFPVTKWGKLHYSPITSFLVPSLNISIPSGSGITARGKEIKLLEKWNQVLSYLYLCTYFSLTSNFTKAWARPLPVLHKSERPSFTISSLREVETWGCGGKKAQSRKDTRQHYQVTAILLYPFFPLTHFLLHFACLPLHACGWCLLHYSRQAGEWGGERDRDKKLRVEMSELNYGL